MQQQPNQGLTFRTGFNLLYLLASAHATCLTVFMRHSFGSEALGLNAIGALGLMVIYVGFTNSHAMAAFLTAWLVVLLCQRIRTYWLWRQGRIMHSRYEGYLWLGWAFPLVRRCSGAKLFEMLFCMTAGALLCGVDLALGEFVLVGFFSLLVKAGIEGEIEQRRLQRMRDAEIEMRQMVEYWNQSRN